MFLFLQDVLFPKYLGKQHKLTVQMKYVLGRGTE